MNLISQYKDYVNWCDEVEAYPIGFVNWKAKKFGYVWDKKRFVYIKKDKLTH